MKTRIVSALALAAAVSLGATGCGMFVPQATTFEYEPSDGVSVNLPDVKVMNLMLITTDEADEANIVFTGVNNGESPARVTMQFIGEGNQPAEHTFTIQPGVTIFGEPGADQAIVEVPGAMPGGLATAFVSSGGSEIEKLVPILDGTLEEYEDFVPAPVELETIEVEAIGPEEADAETTEPADVETDGAN